MKHIHQYINATPLDAHLGRDHWPTDAEYVALHKARDATSKGGKGAAYDVAVGDGSGNQARVYWDDKSGDIRSEIIAYSYPSSRAIIKQWNGVPEKAPGVTVNNHNHNHNTIVVQPGGQGNTHHHHSHVDARQDNRRTIDARQWHQTNTANNYARGDGMTGPQRRYVNAKPHNDFIDHWPTEAEMEALHRAKQESDRLFAKGRTGTSNAGRVPIKGGNGARAQVWRDAPQAYAAFIEAPNPTTHSGWMPMKGWWGVPEWEYNDFGIKDAHIGRQQPMRRPTYIPGPQVNIQAPQTEVHRIVRDVHVYHQDRIHHHHGEPEHIHVGQQSPIDIQSGPAQINVQRPDGFLIQHHEAPVPPRSLWATMLLGPAKAPQQSLPAPQERYRGQLQAQAPQGPRALPRPSEQPIPMPAIQAPRREVAALPPPERSAGGWFSSKQKVR